MAVSRRRLFQSLALAAGAGSGVAGADPVLTLDALRAVSSANGTGLSDDRLQVIQPVLEHRLAQVRALREFEFTEAVEPTAGILDK